MLRPVAGTTNEPEAELFVTRLAEAGITAVSRRSTGDFELGASGGRTIFVEDEDVERARALLAVDEPPFSDEELGELSEAAGREESELEDDPSSDRS
jgi:Putative prokaryotic signal transducing protein